MKSISYRDVFFCRTHQNDSIKYLLIFSYKTRLENFNSQFFSNLQSESWNFSLHCLLPPWPLVPMHKLDLVLTSVQEQHGVLVHQILLGFLLSHQLTSLFITLLELVAQHKLVATLKCVESKTSIWTATDGLILVITSASETTHRSMKAVAGTAQVLTHLLSTLVLSGSASWVTSCPPSLQQLLWTLLKLSSFAQEIGDASQPPTDLWDIDKTSPQLALETLCSTTSKDGQDFLKFILNFT